MANALYSNMTVPAALAADITASATSIVLVAGGAARLPTITGSNYIYATLFPLGNPLSADREIVKITAISGETLTVTRGQQSTTAKAWSVGDKLEIRVTADGLKEFVTTTDAISADLTAHIGDTVGAHAATAISNTPAGSIAATTVQAAINELDSSLTSAYTLYAARMYGITGNAKVRYNNAFYQDTGHTLAATDNTTLLQTMFTDAHTLATGYQTVTIDLEGMSCLTTSDLHITKNQITIANGQICQATETEDCLVYDGETPSTPLMYARLDNVSFQHAYTTATSGVLIRNKRLLGYFVWNGRNIICEGGFRGFMHDGGTIFESTLENIWMNNLWGSGFYMPANGETIDPFGTALTGGSTTTYLRNCFVSDIQTIEPAYDIGNKFNTVILDTCAADAVCSFGRFDAIQGAMRQCSSEEIRHPISGTLPNPHYIIEVFTGYGFAVDGFALAVAAGFATVAGAHAFISTKCPLKISGISGAAPNTNYAGIRTDAAVVEGTHGLTNVGADITLNGGRILQLSQTNIGGAAFSAYLPTANQSVTSGVATKVSLSTEDFDTTAQFDATTNYRFTPTVAGYYQISGNIFCAADANTLTIAYAAIFKNGSVYKIGGYLNTASGETYFGSSVTSLVYLNGSSDYVELYGAATGTTPLFLFGSTQTYLTGILVARS